MAMLISIIVGALTAVGLFRIIFETKEDFIECIKFWFTPDIISIFRGEYFDNNWANFKLWIWVATSSAMGYGTYALLHK